MVAAEAVARGFSAGLKSEMQRIVEETGRTYGAKSVSLVPDDDAAKLGKCDMNYIGNVHDIAGKHPQAPDDDGKKLLIAVALGAASRIGYSCVKFDKRMFALRGDGIYEYEMRGG